MLSSQDDEGIHRARIKRMRHGGLDVISRICWVATQTDRLPGRKYCVFSHTKGREGGPHRACFVGVVGQRRRRGDDHEKLKTWGRIRIKARSQGSMDTSDGVSHIRRNRNRKKSGINSMPWQG